MEDYWQVYCVAFLLFLCYGSCLICEHLSLGRGVWLPGMYWVLAWWCTHNQPIGISQVDQCMGKSSKVVCGAVVGFVQPLTKQFWYPTLNNSQWLWLPQTQQGCQHGLAGSVVPFVFQLWHSVILRGFVCHTNWENEGINLFSKTAMTRSSSRVRDHETAKYKRVGHF